MAFCGKVRCPGSGWLAEKSSGEGNPQIHNV